MKRTDAYSAWLIFIVFSVFLLVIPHEIINQWRLSFLSFCSRSKKTTSELTSPAIKTLEKKRGSSDLHTRLNDAERLNREYRNRLMKSQAELSQVRKNLSNIAELKEYHPEIKFIYAKIFFRNFKKLTEQDLYAGSEIFIDKGLSAGISVSSAALQGQSVMGIVNKSFKNASLIRLLTHPDIIIPGKLQNSLKECYIRGNSNGTTTAVFFGNKPEVALGNIIFTSGLLKIFPENLLIGEITSLPKLSKDKKTYICIVKPSADIYAVDSVLIVKKTGKK